MGGCDSGITHRRSVDVTVAGFRALSDLQTDISSCEENAKGV